jgi:parallel beta-helix repeat protein
MENVTASDNLYGICVRYCNSNTLTGNTASNNRSIGIQLSNCSNNTLTDNTSSNGRGRGFGMVLERSEGSTLANNTVSNNHTGIRLRYSSDNSLLRDNTVSDNGMGIRLESSSGSTLTNNMASNNGAGIWLESSGGSTLSGNIMSDNGWNFSVEGSSDSHFENDIDITNTVDGRPVYYVKNAVGNIYDSSTNAGVFYAINCDNITVKDLTPTKNKYGVVFWKTSNSRIENVTALGNQYGIHLAYSNRTTVANNTALQHYRGIHLDHCETSTITANMGPILLEYCGGSILTHNTASDWDSGIVTLYCNNSILTDNTASNNTGAGIVLYEGSGNRVTNNTASNNHYGFVLYYCSSSSVVKNSAMLNENGIYLMTANNNSLTGNTVAGSGITGMLIGTSSYNEIYNNNFIDNAKQVYMDSMSIDNVFNLDKPIGGNYWSDWTSPDEDGDGFVDYPYEIYGWGNLVAQDNLPWVREDGWRPRQAIQALAVQVMALNLQHGIENELDVKLDAALRALDEINANNDVAAINTLGAFIDAVQAQSGKKISKEDAAALEAAAQEIIDLLSAE